MRLPTRTSPPASGPGCDHIGFAHEMLQTAQLLSVLQRALQDEVKTLRAELADIRESTARHHEFCTNISLAGLQLCPRVKDNCINRLIQSRLNGQVSKDKCVSSKDRKDSKQPHDVQMMRDAYRHGNHRTAWRRKELKPDASSRVIDGSSSPSGPAVNHPDSTGASPQPPTPQDEMEQ